MFAPDVETWLQANSTPSYRKYLEGSRADTAALLDDASIPADSALAHFYLHHGAASCRGWYDLNEPDAITDATQYARDEWGVPEGYIALSGFEGDGVVLYALETGAVYDVERGDRLEQFLGGFLPPIATSFEGYLRWCMSRLEAR
jgi:hypothetical protein